MQQSMPTVNVISHGRHSSFEPLNSYYNSVKSHYMDQTDSIIQGLQAQTNLHADYIKRRIEMRYPKKFELIGNKVRPAFKLNNLEHIHKMGIGLDMVNGRCPENHDIAVGEGLDSAT